ncbi:MAG: hypothetical protein JO042_09260 [Sinobacteraceae bacterium]|nr:hypothetical protein [Nevskiaceae bacterium]
MHRLWALLILGVSCYHAPVFATPSQTKRAELLPRLTAEQIVDKNVAARGGLDAWRKVQSMVWIGHLESEHAPLPHMGFVLEQKRPNSSRFQLIGVNTRSQRVFDGRQGWKTRPSGNAELSVAPYSIQELRFAQAAPGLDGPLIDYQRKGNHIELVGLENIEGREAWHLHVQLVTGERDELWIDERTFLDLRYDRLPLTEGAVPARAVSVIYRDYKRVDGLQVPSIIETGAGAGVQPDRMLVERIVINAPLNDAIFAKPGGRGHGAEHQGPK